MSEIVLLVAVVSLAVLALRWYRWINHNSITHLRGPPVASRLLGNIRDFAYQENVGDLDFKYLSEYGTAWRLKGPLGSNVLMLADPKGLQHVFHKSGYLYTRSAQARLEAYMLTGKSLGYVRTNEAHARHRKALTPGFTLPQLRTLLPLFRGTASKMTEVLKNDILNQSANGAVVSMNAWMARLTLDVIGEAAFDYDFGAINNSDNELTKVYHNLFADANMYPSAWSTVFRSFLRYLPDSALESIANIPTREYSRFKRTLSAINGVSRQLVAQKRAAHAASDDKSSMDVMSILVRANASADPKTKLSEEEMIAQMSVIMLAGHDTTANTITWLLYELAKHPDAQDKLRAEIALKRSEVTARGDVEFTLEDLESMEYLQAAIKETLRYHNIVYHLFREATQDDVIPLSIPIVDRDGNSVTEIPVAKGQLVISNVSAYNRVPEVWGVDAHEWNPMRHLDGRVNFQYRLGLFGNLMTFSAGVRGCVGWRFSVIETQCLAAELVENFTYSLPPEKPEIIRAPAGLMGPMIKGKVHEGVQLPLLVTPL